MIVRIFCVALLINFVASTAEANEKTTDNPLAAKLVNLSIDLGKIGRDCGWDNSRGDLPIERSLLWSSALLRSAITKDKLTLTEATAIQALMLHRGYINERVTAAHQTDTDCKHWQPIWAAMSADLKTLRPLYLELPSEGDRQRYLVANATTCFLFAISKLDDDRSDAHVIAESAFLYCHESISTDLFADAQSHKKILQSITLQILEARKSKRPNAR